MTLDLLPTMEVLETCVSESDVNEAEQEWIAAARNVGVDLTNLTDGGEGASGAVWTEERKKLFSEWCKRAGKGFSTEARERAMRAVTGRKQSVEEIEKRIRCVRGHTQTANHLEKRLASRALGKGWVVSVEHRQALAEAASKRHMMMSQTERSEQAKGRMTPAVRAKISASLRRSWSSPTLRAEQAIRTKRYMTSPDARARLSESALKQWASIDGRQRILEARQKVAA